MEPAKTNESEKIEKKEPAPIAGAQSVTAASLVADDKAQFPPSRDIDREGDHTEQGDEGHTDEEGTEDPPRRHAGGRPKGRKDSYPRGRPQRKDWANRPMKKTPAQKDDTDDTEKISGEARRIDDERQPADYQGLATFAVDLLTGGLSGFLGEHWRPMPALGPGMPSEREMLIKNLTEYLEENQIKEITPGWMLVIGLAGYAIPRVITTLKLKRAKKSSGTNRDPNAKPTPQPAPEKPSEPAPQTTVEVPPVAQPDKFQSEDANREIVS